MTNLDRTNHNCKFTTMKLVIHWPSFTLEGTFAFSLLRQIVHAYLLRQWTMSTSILGVDFCTPPQHLLSSHLSYPLTLKIHKLETSIRYPTSNFARLLYFIYLSAQDSLMDEAIVHIKFNMLRFTSERLSCQLSRSSVGFITVQQQWTWST